MSFGVRSSDYETILEKNGICKTLEERKQLARHYLDYERAGFLAVFRSAPDVLFVTAAMNSNAHGAWTWSPAGWGANDVDRSPPKNR